MKAQPLGLAMAVTNPAAPARAAWSLFRRQVGRDGHLALGLPHLDAEPDQIGPHVLERREEGRIVEHDRRHPTTESTETRPTPMSSPHHVQGTAHPQAHAQVIARSAHAGVTETKKNVGTKSAKMAGSIQSDTLPHLQVTRETIMPSTLFLTQEKPFRSARIQTQNPVTQDCRTCVKMRPCSSFRVRIFHVFEQSPFAFKCSSSAACQPADAADGVVSKQEIDGAIGDMNDTTASVTRHKDDIAALIHATYRLRTNAIYGLYDQARFAQLPAQLSRRRAGDRHHTVTAGDPGAEQDNTQVAAACRPTSATRSNMLPLLAAKHQGGGRPPAMSKPGCAFRDLGSS